VALGGGGAAATVVASGGGGGIAKTGSSAVFVNTTGSCGAGISCLFDVIQMPNPAKPITHAISPIHSGFRDRNEAAARSNDPVLSLASGTPTGR